MAYSTGTRANVLMGRTSRVSEHTLPEVIPKLQNTPIVSIHLGDSHSAALTGDGRLLTWGSWLRGGLGLGYPRDIPLGEPGGYAGLCDERLVGSAPYEEGTLAHVSRLYSPNDISSS